MKNAKSKIKERNGRHGPTERKALHQVGLEQTTDLFDRYYLEQERRKGVESQVGLEATRTPIKGAKTLRRLKAIANTHEIAPHELESLPVDAPPALKPEDLPVIESDMPPVVSEQLQQANRVHQLAMAESRPEISVVAPKKKRYGAGVSHGRGDWRVGLREKYGNAC